MFKFIKKHWKLIVIIAYLLLPVDLIPELFLGPIGTIDDIFALLILFAQYFMERRKEKVLEGELEEDKDK